MSHTGHFIHADDLRLDIKLYLEGWFNKSQTRQLAKGNKFVLSFGEFLTLWGKRRIDSLTKWMDDGSLYVRQRKHTKDNPNLNGYVLTYKSFAASQSGVMSADNAQICTRGKGLHDCRMGKGDRHSERSRARISASKRGVRRSLESNLKTAATMTGMKRGPMSQAEKDKRSATVRATLAAKKAALAVGASAA